MEKVTVDKDILQALVSSFKELKSDLWYQIECKHGVEVAYKYPSLQRANDVLRMLEKKLIKLEFNNVDNFINDLKETYNTEFFFVGGCVRDAYLLRDFKDIDIIIPHIDVNDLGNLLNKYGVAEMVGESFPVYKFMPYGYKGSEPIDVTVPRIERSTGDGHKDFDVIFNKEITLQEDLLRRDFTINSLAMDSKGNIIDLFGGLEDLQNGLIKIITTNSFAEDPLRILRAIQFSVRLDFKLSEETLISIGDTKSSLINISPERIRGEIEKGLTAKLNYKRFDYLLNQTVGFDNIFGLVKSNIELDYVDFRHLSYVEIIHLWFGGSDFNRLVEVFYLGKDERVYLEQLLILDRKTEITIHDIYALGRKSPLIIDSHYVSIKHRGKVSNSWFFNFVSGIYPMSPKDLVVGGEYFMEKGFKGIEIGKIQTALVNEILSDNIKNNFKEIDEYVDKYSRL